MFIYLDPSSLPIYCDWDLGIWKAVCFDRVDEGFSAIHFQGKGTREDGYLAYYEICEAIDKDNWDVVRQYPGQVGPYAHSGNQWVGYDDLSAVRDKSVYVSEEGLGGIMFWTIDNDDFRGACHDRPFPLIEAAKEALYGRLNAQV